MLARNGVEVGIKLSGTGEAWFVGPAALPDPAALFDGYTRDGHEPRPRRLRDRGGLRPRRPRRRRLAGCRAPHVGLDPADAEAITERLLAIAVGRAPAHAAADPTGDVPAILGVDARAVVATGIRPPVHTGIAHVRPGVGQIGGGVTHPPMEAFHAALAALEP